jgi:hypothetical protein
MEKDYSIFRTFQTLDEAKEMKGLFKLNGIDSIIADNKSPLASTFSRSSIQNSIEIRVNQTDFKKANDVLIKEEESILEEIDKDYYLFQFSNEELGAKIV